MPVQRTLFGRPLTLHALPRRFIGLIFTLLGVLVMGFFFIRAPKQSFGPPVAPDGPQDVRPPKPPSIPSKFNPFAPTAHKPPEQVDSTRGDSKWLSDWKWKNPFSSSITLDENTAVLPPLQKRYPVYTFYDDSAKKDAAAKRAENDLLLIWRRAWWAQGFRPIVLSRAEAMHNPLYEAFQRRKVSAELERDFARWLAWGNMGTGILTNWLALPMAKYDDKLLSHLRRGDYAPGIHRFESLGNGLFYGDEGAISSVLKAVLVKSDADFKEANSVKDMLDTKSFTLDGQVDSIAYYEKKTVASSYKSVAAKLDTPETAAEGLEMLGLLMNAHLHNTWQETFSDGISILKPYPQHTTALVEAAVDIARNLTQCPTSPAPNSCPPNRPSCSPCKPTRPHKLQYDSFYRNDSSIYTIGTVPHPFTLTTLHYQKDSITARFLRREVQHRDMWLLEVTKKLLGPDVSGASRAVRIKESIAGLQGGAQSLWLTAEGESHTDLDWIFGFRLPREAASKDGSEQKESAEAAKASTASTDNKADAAPMGPPHHPRPARPKKEEGAPSDIELLAENSYLERAREAIKNKARPMVQVRETVEMWNLADTEAWKFAKAFSARRKMEREKWEEEEKSFAGAESRKEGWGVGRWFD